MAAKKKLPAGITHKEGARLPYQVRPYDRVNKKKGRLMSFATLSEAVAYKEKVDDGRVKAAGRQFTADEWVERWTTHPGFRRKKDSTNNHNAAQVAKFGQDFKGVPLLRISRSDARDWASENEHRVPAVRAMLTDAMMDGIIESNPFMGLKISRGPGRKYLEPLTEKEVRELADIAYRKWEDWPVLGSMIIFSAYTGLRLGEALAVRWTDIDWETATIRVERQWSQKQNAYSTPKSGRARTILMPEKAAEALRLLDRTQSPDGVVWYSVRGKHMNASLLDYYWRQVLSAFNEKLTPERRLAVDLEWHALRHFTASWMVDRGAQAHDIAGQLGHTDGGKLVMDLYGHLYTDNSLARLRNSLAA